MVSRMCMKAFIALFIIGVVGAGAFDVGTVMWTQLSQTGWYSIFRGNNGTSTFVQVPYPSKCANCWGYSAVDRTNRIYYYLMPNSFRTSQWTLAGVSYKSIPASLNSICTFNETQSGASYAATPYGFASGPDGTLYALLHSPSGSLGVYLAKIDPQSCTQQPVSTQAPLLDYVPIRGGFQPSNPEVYNGMLVFMATSQTGVVAVSVDLATGKLIAANPLPGAINTRLPMISVGLDSSTGIGYIQAVSYGGSGQFASIDYNGKVNGQWFNVTNSRSFSPGMMVDSRSAQAGQPGPNFIDFVGSDMSFWAARISGDKLSLVMTAYVRGGGGSYPTIGALFGYRYDETSRLGVN